jgi:polyferredoxin
MLIYFIISLVVILLSTLNVARGFAPAKELLKFLMVIPLPGPLPQMIDFPNIAPWLTNLSYRFYSMMLTTTTLGFVLSLLYKPRTWCTICPINTISDVYLQGQKKRTIPKIDSK